MAKSKKTINEIVQEEYPAFANEVNTLSTEQLNNKLAKLAKDLEESETHKEENTDLEDAKTLASELGAPYRDMKKAVRTKSKYIINLLKERGADA